MGDVGVAAVAFLIRPAFVGLCMVLLATLFCVYVVLNWDPFEEAE